MPLQNSLSYLNTTSTLITTISSNVSDPLLSINTTSVSSANFTEPENNGGSETTISSTFSTSTPILAASPQLKNDPTESSSEYSNSSSVSTTVLLGDAFSVPSVNETETSFGSLNVSNITLSQENVTVATFNNSDALQTSTTTLATDQTAPTKSDFISDPSSSTTGSGEVGLSTSDPMAMETSTPTVTSTNFSASDSTVNAFLTPQYDSVSQVTFSTPDTMASSNFVLIPTTTQPYGSDAEFYARTDLITYQININDNSATET
ncbi:unnamed protein product [Caenorhabditis auriculariae]|uniref:Uncharacterized protein n=1 Tax=Caenorhabditis auriculariae TaxID=2777116 RepID=A0A8S1HHR3_9PELO|nr:unnamed protein product [Caenorhabditis auriculariae]